MDDDGVAPLVLFDAETGRYSTDPATLDWLRGQREPLGVLACAGRYRTGKSYLLNRLCGRPGAFRVGETVQACTHGIWLHKRLLRADGCAYVVLDTEGIDALDADNTHDARIFTLGLLLSSLFVFNSVGALDESSMQTLALMTRVSECVRAAPGDGAEAAGALADHMPHFLWVLRDFTLRLTDRDGQPIDEAAYLEEALRPREGAAADRDAVRRHVRESFRERSLFTLPRPASDEHLGRLDTHPRHAAPAFNARVSELKARIARDMRPVRAGGVDLTGSMYAALCEHLVAHMGAEHGRVPVIRDAWSLMEEAQLKDGRAAAADAVRAAADGLLDARRAPRRVQAELAAAAEQAVARFAAAAPTGPAATRAEGELRAELAELCAAAVARARKAHASAADRLCTLDAAAPDPVGLSAAVQRATEARAALRRDEPDPEPEWIAEWYAGLLDRLLDRWLPAAEHAAEERLAAARAEAAGTRAEAAQAAARAAARAAEAEAQLHEERTAADMTRQALEQELGHLREQLQTERERGESGRRAAEAAAAAAAEAALNRPPPPPPHAEEQAPAAPPAACAACAGCTAWEEEARTAAARAAEAAEAAEAELRASGEREQGLRAELQRERAEEAGRTRQFVDRLDELRAENDAAIGAMRTESRRTEDGLRGDVARLRAELVAVTADCHAAEERWEEARENAAREARRAREADERAQLRVADMHGRVLALHRESLDETRAREERARQEQDRRSAELLEAHGRLSTVLVEAEQCRGENLRVKRQLQDAQAGETELKRLRRVEEEKGERLLRCEGELKEARARREELVHEREALRSQLLESERALALATREMHLERARLRAGGGALPNFM